MVFGGKQKLFQSWSRAPICKIILNIVSPAGLLVSGGDIMAGVAPILEGVAPTPEELAPGLALATDDLAPGLMEEAPAADLPGEEPRNNITVTINAKVRKLMLMQVLRGALVAQRANYYDGWTKVSLEVD